MPRRAPPPQAIAPVDTLVAPPPPSPLIQKLRQDYRWASISQFCFTFSDAFGNMSEWDIEKLEADFDGDETQLIPDILVKLLFALTYNRMINRENVMDNIRKQYEKRSRPCVLGTTEDPIEWATLGLGGKVQLIYELCEVQLEDPARFRGLLKSEEEATSWRVDPAGWDKQGNTYFLFDDNRLWVQRLPPPPPAPPRPPKKSSLKAKKALKRQRQSTTATSAKQTASTAKPSRPPPKPRQSVKKEETPDTPVKQAEEPVSGTRRRTQVAFYGNPTPTAQALKRGGNSAPTPSSSRSVRSTRAHPLDPKAEKGNVADTPVKSGAKGKGKAETPVSLPRGTRVSRRLRDTGDEWQQVPPEWLQNGEGSDDAAQASTARSRVNGKTAKVEMAEEDADSDLSELTDEEEHEAKVKASGVDSLQASPVKPVVAKAEDEKMDIEEPQTNGHSPASSALSELDAEVNEPVTADAAEDDDFKPESVDLTPELDTAKSSDDVDEEIEVDEDEAEEDEEDEVKMAVKEANTLPEGFVEWEAVCVTLYDWRTFPEQFAKSRDRDEKDLYRYLTQDVGPVIIEALVERAQQKAKEDAVMNRKRSSRIATIQLEREEIIRNETAQREMEERMERTRKEEKRREREEAELARREKAREDRLKEREERAQAREDAVLAKAREESEKMERAERDRQERARRREEGLSAVSTPNERSNSAAPVLGDGAANQPEGWELNCEVCKKRGWNLDDDEDVVACEDCGRWQHMGCHDMQDIREGRRKRKWDKVDFRCHECLAKLAKRQVLMPTAYASAPQRLHAVSGQAHPSNGSVGHGSYGREVPPHYTPQPAREYRPLPSHAASSAPPPQAPMSSAHGHHTSPRHGASVQHPSTHGATPDRSPFSNAPLPLYPPQHGPPGAGYPSPGPPGRPPVGYRPGPPPHGQSPYPPGQYAPSPYGPSPHYAVSPRPPQHSPQGPPHHPLPSPSHPRQTPPNHPQHLPAPYPPHPDHRGQPQQRQQPPYPPQPPYAQRPPYPPQGMPHPQHSQYGPYPAHPQYGHPQQQPYHPPPPSHPHPPPSHPQHYPGSGQMTSPRQYPPPPMQNARSHPSEHSIGHRHPSQSQPQPSSHGLPGMSRPDDRPRTATSESSPRLPPLPSAAAHGPATPVPQLRSGAPATAPPMQGSPRH